MGKGDRRTRRGKIYNGSFGKSRPKDTAVKAKAKAKPKAPVAKAAPAAAGSRAKR